MVDSTVNINVNRGLPTVVPGKVLLSESDGSVRWGEVPRGIDGRGISSFERVDDDTVLVNFTDGSEPQTITLPPGRDGKSAYDLWLEQGNTGTEEDYLKSLTPDFVASEAEMFDVTGDVVVPAGASIVTITTAGPTNLSVSETMPDGSSVPNGTTFTLYVLNGGSNISLTNCIVHGGLPLPNEILISALRIGGQWHMAVAPVPGTAGDVDGVEPLAFRTVARAEVGDNTIHSEQEWIDICVANGISTDLVEIEYTLSNGYTEYISAPPGFIWDDEAKSFRPFDPTYEGGDWWHYTFDKVLDVDSETGERVWRRDWFLASPRGIADHLSGYLRGPSGFMGFGDAAAVTDKMRKDSFFFTPGLNISHFPTLSDSVDVALARMRRDTDDARNLAKAGYPHRHSSDFVGDEGHSSYLDGEETRTTPVNLYLAKNEEGALVLRLHVHSSAAFLYPDDPTAPPPPPPEPNPDGTIPPPTEPASVWNGLSGHTYEVPLTDLGAIKETRIRE